MPTEPKERSPLFSLTSFVLKQCFLYIQKKTGGGQGEARERERIESQVSIYVYIYIQTLFHVREKKNNNKRNNVSLLV